MIWCFRQLHIVLLYWLRILLFRFTFHQERVQYTVRFVKGVVENSYTWSPTYLVHSNILSKLEIGRISQDHFFSWINEGDAKWEKQCEKWELRVWIAAQFSSHDLHISLWVWRYNMNSKSLQFIITLHQSRIFLNRFTSQYNIKIGTPIEKNYEYRVHFFRILCRVSRE